MHLLAQRASKDAQADPLNYLALQPLQNHQDLGGHLHPGQLLSVMPPLILDTGDFPRS
jgi:hypothetical protein